MTPTFRPASPSHKGQGGKEGFPQKTKPAPEPALRKMRILVVDDEANIARILQKVLEKGGREVMTARNGEEGYEIFRAGGVDVVISDFDMPLMNGLQMLREIKRLVPDAKVIMMSASSGEKEREEMISAGALTVIPKPFDFRELMAAIDKAVSL